MSRKDIEHVWCGHGSFSWSSAPVLCPPTIIPFTLKLGRNFPSPICFLTSLLALLKSHQTGGSSGSADAVGAGTSGGWEEQSGSCSV